MSRYRHVKRGTVYEVIGTALLQSSAGPVDEDAELVIYQDQNGRSWARPKDEFDDGRFERIEEPCR